MSLREARGLGRQQAAGTPGGRVLVSLDSRKGGEKRDEEGDITQGRVA